MATSTKGLIRAKSRAFAATGKTKPAEAGRRASEPSACERCGAVFRNRVWRRDVQASHALLARARWTVCPACKHAAQATGMGRIRIVGDRVAAHEDLIRRRIANVATRAQTMQPERRVVSIDWAGGALEVLTTSQKLAHRIVHELKKVLGGKATYGWNDDGTLYATWAPRAAAAR